MTTLWIDEYPNRKFSAKVQVLGNAILGVGNYQEQAIKDLESKLEGMNVSLKDCEIVYTVKQFPLTRTALPVREKQAMPGFPKLDQGFVTPISDKDTWCSVFHKAIEIAMSTMSNAYDKENASKFRAEVNMCMESGQAGVPSIGAYRVMPCGDRWIRLSGLDDPAVRKPRQGEGLNRARHHKDINGNWVDVSGEPEKRRGRKAEKEPGRYEYPGLPPQKAAGMKMAKAMKAKAVAAGKDESTQQLWFKIGYVMALRSMDAPYHTQYETELMQAGLKEEELRAYTVRFTSI
jgi:hypothetical protein